MQKGYVELFGPGGQHLGTKLQDSGRKVMNVLRREMLLFVAETQE